MAINYPELLRSVGRKLGYSRNPDFWTADARQDVDDSISAGLRQFYYPPPIEGQEERHAWSFLRDRTALTTVAGTDSYDLDEDVVGVGEEMTGDSSVSPAIAPLRRVSEEYLLALEAKTAVTGVPYYFCVRQKTFSARVGQRLEVLLHPTPDAAYVLTYQITFDPGALSDENPYPAGGHLHAETILESCIAAARSTLEDAEQDAESPYDARFLKLLRASILADGYLEKSEK